MTTDDITSLPSRFARRAPEPGWPSFERCLKRFLHGQTVHQTPKPDLGFHHASAGEAHGRIGGLQKDFRPTMTQSISPYDLNTTSSAPTPPSLPLPTPPAAPVGFEAFDLTPPLLRALAEEGYRQPTPIQLEAIPHVLAGKDLLGCAQTGTGKTAAFALPVLHRLSANATTGRGARCLVLCPTRELATQIAGDFRSYGRHLQFRVAVIFGGVNQNPQVQALKQGLDIIVATPGRLLDLIDQRFVDLRSVQTLV